MDPNHVIMEVGDVIMEPPCLRKKKLRVPSVSSNEYLMELKKRHRFWVAMSKQNEVADTAIKSLDCLNDQIVQYIVSGRSSPVPEVLSANEDDDVKASMVLIRRLLLDAQARFRRMVEDNRQLASHIDDSIQAANQEVNLLRAELVSTNKRLSQITIQDVMGKSEVGTQVETDLLQGGLATEGLEQTVKSLTQANQQLMEDYKELLENHDGVKVTNAQLKTENEKVQTEKQRLETELVTLQREYNEIRQIKLESGGNGTGKPSYGELKLELIQTRQEMTRAKEVLQGLKSDRKRLKGEKLDLLSQMKQLYTTLEEKEMELQEFIRNYEQRVKESDDMIKQVDMLAREKEETDHEKWEIITKARDAAERAVFFRAQLDNREQQVKSLETELGQSKRLLANLGHSFPSPSLALSSSVCSSNSNVNDNDNSNFLMSNTDTYSISSTGEDTCLLNFNASAMSTPMLGGKALAASTPALPSPRDGNGPLVSMFPLGSDVAHLQNDGKVNSSTTSLTNNGTANTNNNNDGSKKKKKSFHGLSRMFSKARVRRSITLSKGDSLNYDEPIVSCAKLSVLNQDNYQEKLATVEHMQGLDMREWRAHQVLAWLEITLGMPMYAVSCLQNIKSGKVLLGLSDSELSSALNVSNHIHRRKLRLSIEQNRNPKEIKYPKANEMDPTWIAHRFMPDLGLPQYTTIFEEQLCDGHVINTLTRKDLEKYFSVHRKFHQSSIMHAVELLRRIEFDKEKLYKRRTVSDDVDNDMIVWTNERLVKWIESIDLGEYAENLKESGLHGAVMVLEPSFCSDVLSSVLGIPPSKSYIRRHLTEELDTILKPARKHQKGLKILRAALDSPEAKDSPEALSRSKDRKLSRSRHSSASEDGRTRLSFRGSLGKAFGKKVKEELKLSFDSESSKKKISAPIPIQHSSLSSLENNSELLKKGFCVPDASKNGAKLPLSQTDLQKSLSATGALNKAKTGNAGSQDKLGKAACEASVPKRTVVDLVKGLKTEAAVARGDHGGCAANAAGNVNLDAGLNRVSSKKKESSLTSSSSQDTLTELSAVEPISRESSREGKDDNDHSQTESVSQSSSTESALQERTVASPNIKGKLPSTCFQMASKPPLTKAETDSGVRYADGDKGQKCSDKSEMAKIGQSLKKATSLQESSLSQSTPV